ncbi:MAG TPA: type IV pilus secretin family protein [Deltaproteobacteria bacterium]|nr:type IV pilus secretin family protein [Deltaproteobacteria bacterium]
MERSAALEGEDAVDLWGSEEDSAAEMSSIDGMPEENGPGSMPSASPIELSPPPAATRLSGVTAEQVGSGVLIGLQADGTIASLEAFTLTDPPRLVVDLPGLTLAGAPSRLDVGSEFVKDVRVGAHEGKVRVVLDGGSLAGDFEGRRVMPGATGLWISVGEGEALVEAMNDAIAASEAAWMAAAEPIRSTEQDSGVTDVPASMDDPVDSSEAMAGSEDHSDEADASIDPTLESLELTEVYGLHYERTDGMDRTAILSDDALAYEALTPDATTFVLSMKGAKISKEASDRIFPKAGGPISMIRAFQQPDVAEPEVRVVFTRAPNLQPVISRRGSMLFVDFEDVGVAAAPPPAFPNAGMEDESGVASITVNDTEDDTLDGTAMTSPASTTVDPMEIAAEEALIGTAPAADADSATRAMKVAAMPVEVDSGLPGFDAGEIGGAPAALDPNDTLWDAPTSASAPAAVEVPAAIEVLEEGGLIDGKEYRGRRVSLDFKDVAIADVLRLIAEVSDLNIIAGDEVAGNVTIRLVEVPWDQALDVILMTKGLGFVRVGNVLRIAPAEVLKAEEEVRLQERRNKEKLEDLEVKLLPVNYAAVKDIEGLVKRLLSARGTVNLDERTNTLIIKDISSVIDEATALIAAIDTQTPQVMIEAKIVEATLDFSRELGSVWGIQTQRFVDPFDPDTPRTDLGTQDLTFIDSNSLQFANPITSVPNGLLTLGALILDQDFRIDAQIQAAESTGDGKVISSPRIVTLDNKKAKIEQGVSIPFQTFEGGDAKLEFIDAVLSLVVTPHITANESIVMKIEVTRNAPDDSVATPTGSPAIAKNQAKTETLVKDGQTLVLGGIYTINKSRRQTRIPYLHRIPVIGNAFKSNEITDARKELLVFVTPRIVRLPEMAEN